MLQPLLGPSVLFKEGGIDSWDPLPVSAPGHREVETVVGHFNRYAQTHTFRTGCSVEVAEVFLHSTFLRRRSQRAHLSYRAKAVLSTTLAEILRSAEIVHKTTSNYEPRKNGLTELFDRKLSDMSSTYIQPDHVNWNTIRLSVSYAHTFAVRRTIDFTPYFLYLNVGPLPFLIYVS